MLKIGDIIETTYGDSKCVVTEIYDETFEVVVVASQFRWKIGYVFKYKSRDRWKFSDNLVRCNHIYFRNSEIVRDY